MNPLLAALSTRAADDVVVDGIDRSLTAQQLRAGIEQVSEALVKKGIDRAGLLAANSAAWVTADLACHVDDPEDPDAPKEKTP